MGASHWIAENWFDLLLTVGIVGGMLFTAYIVRKDERARKISNVIALSQEYRDIWQELYYPPKLFRVSRKDQPCSLSDAFDRNYTLLGDNLWSGSGIRQLASISIEQ